MVAALHRSARPVYGKNPHVAVEVGQVISSKYKLLRLLGDGGMGSVYEAEHIRLGTHVALKVLHADLSRRAGLIDRFLQEARVSAQLRSPHVVHVTDVESTPDGVAYLVMELLQGEPLSSVVKRERTLSVGTACEYASQILQALEAAHSLGVIHRDLKPDNVFVTFEGGKPVLKLIDFGIAKLKQGSPGAVKNLTVAGMLMGTPEYMAPEQAYSAADVDLRADIYAVGVMLYEMLSGQPPVAGGDPRVVVLKVERGEVTPLVHVAPSVPPEVAGLVHRAMAPRPEMRFASATEMRLAIEAVVSGKRAGTVKIAGSAVAQANAAALALAATPEARAAAAPPPMMPPAPIGTGTVMGAPAEGALTPGSGPPPPQRPGTGTVRAAPIDAHALQMATPPPHQPHGPMPMHASTGVSAYGSTRPPARSGGGGSGLIIALAVVALLLGAGAVVTYVMGTTASPPPPPDPFATMTAAPTTPPIPTTTPAVTATVAPGPAATLAPGPTVQPQPQPQPRPSTTPTRPPPSASASGSAAPSTAAPPPPFPFPSGLPNGFPSAIPLPSAFPLPSGFPTFQWPPPPPPAQ